MAPNKSRKLYGPPSLFDLNDFAQLNVDHKCFTTYCISEVEIMYLLILFSAIRNGKFIAVESVGINLVFSMK